MNGNVPRARVVQQPDLNFESSALLANGGPLRSKDDTITVDRTKVLMLQERMAEMRELLLNDLNDRLNDMMSEMMKRLRLDKSKHNGVQTEMPDKSQKRRNGQIAEKEFVARNSYLTDLFEIDHIRTIYNIFIVMLLILFLNSAVNDYLETGTMNLGIKTVRSGFGNIFDVLKIWTLMLLSTFVTYVGVSFWANKRVEMTPKSISMKLLDYGFLAAFACNQIAFVVVPTKLLLDEKLRPASSMAIMMEQVRMLMKTHAFVRSIAPRILAQKAKDEDRVSNCPGFSKFLYFMFAPTLIYKDDYPRTKQIRWKIVFWNLLEVVMVVFYVAFIFERFVIPPFEKYGPAIFEPRAVIRTIFNIMLPSLIMFLFGFYCILHSSQNCMAELLRFADRLFYKDWWNCTSYAAWYRSWNILVHDWLYTYIYKDVYEKLHNRVIATLATFLISAIFHEYIFVFAFRFFYPVMLVLFGGFGMMLVFIMRNYSKVDGNIFIWWSLFTGNGILFTLYSMEYYARTVCPPYEDKLLDLLLPRSWVCHNYVTNNSTIMS